MNSESPEGPHERIVGCWYSVTRDGLACLCLDEANAREMAVQCDRDYPKHAPHKAMQLVDAVDLDRLRAENERLRALLGRYLDETPLSHQPHMIAHETEAALSRDRKSPLGW